VWPWTPHVSSGAVLRSLRSVSVFSIIGLTAVEAAPPSRTVTLAPGKNTREVALVNKAAELGNIRKLLAWVL
jgi:hypothetical protein